MQLGQPGVQQEAWVLIQALPSLPVCPWAGPSVLSCHPRELEQLYVATGERMLHRQAEGAPSTHPLTPPPPSTAQLFPQAALQWTLERTRAFL